MGGPGAVWKKGQVQVAGEEGAREAWKEQSVCEVGGQDALEELGQSRGQWSEADPAAGDTEISPGLSRGSPCWVWKQERQINGDSLRLLFWATG